MTLRNMRGVCTARICVCFSRIFCTIAMLYQCSPNLLELYSSFHPEQAKRDFSSLSLNDKQSATYTLLSKPSGSISGGQTSGLLFKPVGYKWRSFGRIQCHQPVRLSCGTKITVGTALLQPPVWNKKSNKKETKIKKQVALIRKSRLSFEE